MNILETTQDRRLLDRV